MRVILDECLPRRLGLALTGHVVSTVSQAGWAGISNGKLLARISGNYDVFLTVDNTVSPKQSDFTGGNRGNKEDPKYMQNSYLKIYSNFVG